MCEVCVILTAKKSLSEDSTLLDKEAILCSLNIQAMVFGEASKNSQMMSASGWRNHGYYGYYKYITNKH